MQIAPDQPQQTLKARVSFEGVGLFTGSPSRITITPADPNNGIWFQRDDLEGSPRIRAHVDNVVPRPRRTVLNQAGHTIETVEHCLAALAGSGIDNATVHVEGPEIPALDGSAEPFVSGIRSVGSEQQNQQREYLVISEPVTIRDGDALLAAYPPHSTTFDMLYALDFGKESPIQPQLLAYHLDYETFHRDIAPARTFSSQQEAEAARDHGLFTHLSPSDMLVIGHDGPIQNAYRYSDEPVRHKLLDLLGDISLTGKAILGRIVAMRSGHALNHQLARELLSIEAAAHKAATPTAPAMDIRDIMKLLPHRYPMVLVDRVTEMDADQRAVGIKNVSINEPFFQGHYPGTPIMPGVLIIEAMSQLAGLMLSQKLERTGKIAVLLTLDAVKLRKSVTPGDQLVLETEALRTSTRFGDVQARAFVAGDVVAEARIKFMMVDAERQ